jgi:Kef-type K+ transport system membrane component KefB
VNWVTFDPIAPTAETILGAFMAGAILSLLDRDEQMTHPAFRRKLEAVGFGIFIPVFFVASGVNFDLDALLESASNVIMVPIFLAALVAARGLPALLYRGLLDTRHIAIAGLMQATSLPFIVAATAIGEELGLVSAAEGAALIGAGLLSVLLFPLIGLTLLKRGGTGGGRSGRATRPRRRWRCSDARRGAKPAPAASPRAPSGR